MQKLRILLTDGTVREYDKRQMTRISITPACIRDFIPSAFIRVHLADGGHDEFIEKQVSFVSYQEAAMVCAGLLHAHASSLSLHRNEIGWYLKLQGCHTGTLPLNSPVTIEPVLMPCHRIKSSEIPEKLLDIMNKDHMAFIQGNPGDGALVNTSRCLHGHYETCRVDLSTLLDGDDVISAISGYEEKEPTALILDEFTRANNGVRMSALLAAEHIIRNRENWRLILVQKDTQID